MIFFFTLSHYLLSNVPKTTLYSQCIFERTEAQSSHVTYIPLVRVTFGRVLAVFNYWLFGGRKGADL